MTSGGVVLQLSGLIDLQVNGYGGIDFLSATSEAEIRNAARALQADGVSGFLPTLITSEIEDLKRTSKLINRVAESQEPDEAEILGIHLEGPCLSPESRGVHPEDLLQKPSRELIQQLLDVERVKMITIAPELPGAIDAINRISNAGVIASIGHTNANREIFEAAVDAGARAVTHLFNGMKKDGELIDAILACKEIQIQMIVDDVHVSRELVKSICEVALDRLILVTDAVAPAGLGAGRSSLGGMEIEVRDGRAVRPDGRLAGGLSRLSRSIEILAELGFDQSATLPSVTSRPLELINAS